jgi:hypothetical protein
VSARPTAPDSGFAALQKEGYEVEVRQQHLLVHSVPYVTANHTVERATMVCKYMESAGCILPPTTEGDDHQVWWTGSFPCRSDGTLMSAELVDNVQPAPFTIFEDCQSQHRFSNKPEQYSQTGYPDHFEKVTHYVTLIQSQAKVIDPSADARTRRVIPPSEPDSVFHYADTASVRAEIVATSARLKLRKVAIVGLGGTGGYVFDQVAKTPVWEIHCFDGDDFKQHNAFRAPGAATKDELFEQMKKVDFFVKRYNPMRKGLLPHAYFLDESNVAELAGFDFVFVCVDKGTARKIICGYLAAQGIPFVDVGMDVVMDAETQQLDGTCRVTTVTVAKDDHLGATIPMDDDKSDALYRQNIQVADLNALNAQLAVIKWKQLFGFYEDRAQAHQTTYTVATQSLTRGELVAIAAQPRGDAVDASAVAT